MAMAELTLREGRCPTLHRRHCILVLKFLRGERKRNEDAHRNRNKKQLLYSVTLTFKQGGRDSLQLLWTIAVQPGRDNFKLMCNVWIWDVGVA